MRYTNLFTKTLKDSPSDEHSKNADLLIRAGYVYKEMAGAYVFLPLGQMVLNNIIEVIREEMNAIGGQELLMTSLQNPEVWQASGRWDDEVMDVWFKTKLKNESELGLAATHEEPLTNLMKQFIRSYKDLPVYAYQFQTKFRNELRAKSGVMRGREFLMKDLYSFSADQAAHDDFYEKAKHAYVKIFERLGLGDNTYLTFASGGSFSKYSHEFQTVSEAGEDLIYIDDEKNIAVNKEVLTDEVLEELGLNRDKLREEKAAEVGNIFSLGTKFSDALGLNFTDSDGENKPVVMGSYGIGPARTMGVIVETFADDKGIVWPEAVAPFTHHMVALDGDDVRAKAEQLYSSLREEGKKVFLDDRNERAGVKLADAELMGMPNIIVLGKKSLENNKYELIDRKTGTKTEVELQ